MNYNTLHGTPKMNYNTLHGTLKKGKKYFVEL